MKDTVWLHIGTHKTGTTAIQNSLQGYDDGVTRYAQLSRPNHSLALSALFRESGGGRKSLEKQGFVGEAADSWMETARKGLLDNLASPGRTLTLSAEGMATFTAGDYRRLRDFLVPHARAIRVLAYVRDPMGYASSMFQQMIKNGQEKFAVPDLGYRSKLGAALEVFGREAMEIVRFDPKTLPDGDVITDFCTRTGVERSRIKPRPANESLSAGAVGLIHAFNRLPESRLGSYARFRARYAMIDQLRRAVPGRLRLSPDLVRAHVAPADLDWLAANFGLDFRDRLQAAEPKPGDIATEADLMDARAAAHDDLARFVSHRFIRTRGRSTDEIMLALFQAQIALQSLIGLVRPRR